MLQSELWIPEQRIFFVILSLLGVCLSLYYFRVWNSWANIYIYRPDTELIFRYMMLLTICINICLLQCVLKEGTLNRTKITENGKKLRKNWAPAHVVLTELFLLFFKDAKTFDAMVRVTHLFAVILNKLVMRVSVLGFAIRSFLTPYVICGLVDSKYMA